MRSTQPEITMKQILVYFFTASFALAAAADQAKPYAGTTVKFASMNDSFVYAIQKILPEFTAETGIKVNLEIIPYAGLRERSLTDLISGSGTFDLITMDIVWMGEWAESNFIVQLDDLVNRDNIDLKAFLPGALKGLSYWKGKVYGMPIGAYYFLMNYRKDLFEANGLRPPETFADVMSDGKKLGSPGQIDGIAEPMVRGAPVVHYTLGFISGAGLDFLDEHGHLSSDLKPVADVIDSYKSFQEIGPKGMLSYDWTSITDAYAQSKIAMVGAWSVVAPDFENPKKSQVVGKTGYAYLPVLKKGDKARVPFGGWSLVINKASKKQQAAWELVKWLLTPKVQKEYAENLGTPVLFQTLEDPDLQAKFPWYKLILQAEKDGIVDPTFRPRIPQWPKIEEALGVELNEVMTGSKTADQALQNIQGAVRTALSSN
jgi:multiple sugar transport system substrate-binding protein